MASKHLFKTSRGARAPKANARNEAGGIAYRLGPYHALAQYAATGCLSGTFYATAEMQLGTVLKLCEHLDPEFIAKTAIYCRQKGHMKDMPALLCAVLSVREPVLLEMIFPRVIDSGKMLRNFVQIMRSGAVGRKSLGSLPRRAVRTWLESRSDEQVFRASVGADPSLADVIKMVHPRPATESRAALYGYLLGREHDAAALPELVKRYEAFKRGETREVPDVPLQLLTSLDLGYREWTAIARNAPWQTVRMSLNTFSRHGVFQDKETTRAIAEKLRDPEQVARSRVFPYQLLMAYSQTRKAPGAVREALQDAMELAIGNVPAIDGKVYIFPDVSGSMHSPVTGHRQGASSAVRCIDVAALVAAAVLRKNPDAEVIPFESTALSISLNPRDSVMTNAKRLASLPCGGTNCSAPLAELNRRQATGDLVIYVSDNESWIDSPRYGQFGGGSTETMRQWEEFKQRSPRARMVCLDVQPYGTVQARERSDILNIGGFSDEVFRVISTFAGDGLAAGHRVRVIESVDL